MKNSKNFNLFLMDGEVTGRIKCTLANWTGLAFKVPSSLLGKCKDRSDLNQSGIYFLFGKNDKEKNEEKVLYIMTKNALGIIPDDDIIISTWNATLEENKRSDLISHSLKVIFINSEAMALEKNIRDDKNKVYISKLVEKKTKIRPYKVFAFTTYTAGSSFYDERSAMYLYTSGYNIIFDTREDYDAALTKKESLEQDICLTLNKLTIDTLRRKTTIQPIIRFLYRDLIKDIDEMDKENRKQF